MFNIPFFALLGGTFVQGESEAAGSAAALRGIRDPVRRHPRRVRAEKRDR